MTTSSRPSRRTTGSPFPTGHLWRDVRDRAANIGQALVTAFREIEKANPETLYGIFGNAGWTNKDKLPDRKLADLIEHFSARSLSNAAVAPDVFGNAYEYLIKRFADQSNKKAGEYYTPRSVVGLLVNILDPCEGETVYDPACGTGGMLIEVIEHVKRAGGRPQTLWGKLYGQEKVLATSGIARMNLLLHGVEDFKIVRGDTLRDPAFFTGPRLSRFDCVIANPPFSLKNWGEEAWATDRWGRNQLGGVPPEGYADWAWVQHMLTSADPRTGRVAVVLPQGALFRQGAEGRIRQHILKADLVEAVIGLAPEPVLRHGPRRLRADLPQAQAVRGTNGQGALRQRRDALQDGAGTRTPSNPSTPTRLLKAYQAFSDQPGLSHVASLDRDRGEGLQPQHPAVRGVGRQRRER